MSTTTQLDRPTQRPARRVRTWAFARHYGEMVLAMVAGMVVIGMPLDAVLGDDHTLALLNMGVSMTVPMVAWMRFRGHRRQATTEMAAAMVVPTLAAVAVYSGGVVEDFGTVMAVEHVVMLVAMAAAMVLRPGEYSHHAHHAAVA